MRHDAVGEPAEHAVVGGGVADGAQDAVDARRPPSSVMIAGTSVIVQATATSDTLIAPTAIVLNMGERMMSSPVMEQAMVSAEKETVRPAVATVRTTLRRTSSFMSAPAGRSPSRWPASSSWMATSSR